VTYAEIFNCQIGSFPLRYLGCLLLLVDCTWLIGSKWREAREKIRCMARGVPTSGARTILINANFSNSMIYHMSMFMIPKINIERMDKMRRTFFDRGEPQEEIPPSQLA
jgi:hypothetical protein